MFLKHILCTAAWLTLCSVYKSVLHKYIFQHFIRDTLWPFNAKILERYSRRGLNSLHIQGIFNINLHAETKMVGIARFPDYIVITMN